MSIDTIQGGPIKEVDFKRMPYRGILSEVAKELGITGSAVSNRIRGRDPKTLTMILRKMKEREAVVREFDAKVSGVPL